MPPGGSRDVPWRPFVAPCPEPTFFPREPTEEELLQRQRLEERALERLQERDGLRDWVLDATPVVAELVEVLEEHSGGLRRLRAVVAEAARTLDDEPWQRFCQLPFPRLHCEDAAVLGPLMSYMDPIWCSLFSKQPPGAAQMRKEYLHVGTVPPSQSLLRYFKSHDWTGLGEPSSSSSSSESEAEDEAQPLEAPKKSAFKARLAGLLTHASGFGKCGISRSSGTRARLRTIQGALASALRQLSPQGTLVISWSGLPIHPLLPFLTSSLRPGFLRVHVFASSGKHTCETYILAVDYNATGYPHARSSQLRASRPTGLVASFELPNFLCSPVRYGFAGYDDVLAWTPSPGELRQECCPSLRSAAGERRKATSSSEEAGFDELWAVYSDKLVDIARELGAKDFDDESLPPRPQINRQPPKLNEQQAPDKANKADNKSSQLQHPAVPRSKVASAAKLAPKEIFVAPTVPDAKMPGDANPPGQPPDNNNNSAASAKRLPRPWFPPSFPDVPLKPGPAISGTFGGAPGLGPDPLALAARSDLFASALEQLTVGGIVKPSLFRNPWPTASPYEKAFKQRPQSAAAAVPSGARVTADGQRPWSAAAASGAASQTRPQASSLGANGPAAKIYGRPVTANERRRSRQPLVPSKGAATTGSNNNNKNSSDAIDMNSKKNNNSNNNSSSGNGNSNTPASDITQSDGNADITAEPRTGNVNTASKQPGLVPKATITAPRKEVRRCLFILHIDLVLLKVMCYF
ncbi:unnamed protein product [Polarella glacialis]|uniref:Uncharacterized protein n=1 Tax=Polarella glacialis TaxID=89957 RepID=A0A813D9V6_POLGL|nr:unnamed protein product [Polarella glacialis]